MHLTDAGKQRLETASPFWENAQKRLREGVGDPQWERIWEVLDRVAGAGQWRGVRDRAGYDGARRDSHPDARGGEAADSLGDSQRRSSEMRQLSLNRRAIGIAACVLATIANISVAYQAFRRFEYRLGLRIHRPSMRTLEINAGQFPWIHVTYFTDAESVVDDRHQERRILSVGIWR